MVKSRMQRLAGIKTNLNESFFEGYVDMQPLRENDQQFEKDFDELVDDIEEGFGWIDPAFVEDTWENSSDIPFDSVEDKVFEKLIAANLLFEPNEEDPSSDVKGNKVTSVDDAKRLSQENMEEENQVEAKADRSWESLPRQTPGKYLVKMDWNDDKQSFLDAIETVKSQLEQDKTKFKYGVKLAGKYKKGNPNNPDGGEVTIFGDGRKL